MANEAISIEDAVADINHQIKRCVGAKAVETKAELVNNVYPLMLNVVEALAARQAETEEIVAQLLGEGESIVQPEFAAQIAEAFAAGGALASAIAEAQMDEVTKQRLMNLVADFSEKTAAVEVALSELTLEDVEEPEDDDEDEDEDE